MNEAQINEAEQIVNSLSGLCETLNAFDPSAGYGAQASQADTMYYNLRWYLVSNLRQLLTEMYVEHGIIQTLVEQPVDDGFRAGFEIKTAQLDENDKEKLMIYLERNQVIASVMQGIKWGRLYGGGAIVIITNQNPEMPFNAALINEKTPLEFRSVDMWELYFNVQGTVSGLSVGDSLGEPQGDFYNYYGKRIHKSRVIRFIGKEAPSFIKPRLRGWGMSELERIIRSLNQYLKNQDVIFELLDEAKVDVYKIKGFTQSMVSKDATNKIASRIQAANKIKNFNSALTMDAEDDYLQKQIAFTGLSEILLQIRQGIACDVKMPMTKLFGISAAGFNSGEDDIENYNSMIEGEIRSKNKFQLVDVIMIACQKVFGFMPDDLSIIWNPLRILNAKEEEEVKDSQFTRITSAFSLGLATAQEAKESINKDSLLGVEVDETTDAMPPLMGGGDIEKPEPAKGKSAAAPPSKGKAV